MSKSGKQIPTPFLYGLAFVFLMAAIFHFSRSVEEAKPVLIIQEDSGKLRVTQPGPVSAKQAGDHGRK